MLNLKQTKEPEETTMQVVQRSHSRLLVYMRGEPLPKAADLPPPMLLLQGRKDAKAETLTERKAREMREAWAEEEARKIATENSRKARAAQRILRTGGSGSPFSPSEMPTAAGRDIVPLQLSGESPPSPPAGAMAVRAAAPAAVGGSSRRRKKSAPSRWIESSQHIGAADVSFSIGFNEVVGETSPPRKQKPPTAGKGNGGQKSSGRWALYHAGGLVIHLRSHSQIVAC